MSRKSLYNSKMSIKRLKLSGQDAVGGITQVITTVLQTACRIRQLRANEQPVGGKDGIVSTHRIYSRTADIRNKDECVIAETIYDVNSVNPTSKNDGSIQVDVTLRV